MKVNKDVIRAYFQICQHHLDDGDKLVVFVGDGTNKIIEEVCKEMGIKFVETPAFKSHEMYIHTEKSLEEPVIKYYPYTFTVEENTDKKCKIPSILSSERFMI